MRSPVFLRVSWVCRESLDQVMLEVPSDLLFREKLERWLRNPQGAV